MTARRRTTTVLAYHAVGPCPRGSDPHNLFVSEEAFAEQMEFLATKRVVVPLSTAVGGPVVTEKPPVAITFDDGYRNVLEIAGPIMQRYGFPSTVFVPTAFIGDKPRWLADSSCDLSIMTADELNAAGAAGISVQSHGHEHIDMGRVEETALRSDLERSVHVIEEITGRRPHFLAYPFGHHSAAAHSVAARAGFRAAFTIDELHGGDLAYERTQITPLDGAILFAFKTTGRYLALRRSRIAGAAYAALRPVLRRK